MGRLIKRALASTALLLSLGAQAQLLDFDAVCAFPPCIVGGLYPGFTFNPGTAQIAAPGVDGLTGPIGGKYLSVPGVAITVTGPKNITDVAYKLSRASTSAGPMSVMVIPTFNGVPVLPGAPAQLDTVNVWTVNGIGFGGIGINVNGLMFLPSTNDPFGIDDIQFTSACYAFTDVQPSDVFCNAVEWLANRGITTGCEPNLFCPGRNVSRGQMALFMNRLGSALSPTVVQRDCARDSTFSPLQRSCLAPHLALHAKLATVVVTCGITNPTAATKTVTGELVYSADGGFTWTSMGHPSYASLPGTPAGTLANTGSIALTQSTNYTFAHEITHHSGDATATLSSECTLVLTVHNRNPTVAPF